MKLSQHSEILMKGFIDKFSSLSINKTAFQQRQMDNIFKILFNDIKQADTFVKNMKLLGKIKSNIIEHKGGKEIPLTDLFNSHFVSQPIREYVIKSFKGYLIFEADILDHHIKIHFALLNSNDLLKSATFEKLMYYAFMWLYMATLYAPSHCAKELDIFCFLTPFKKMLPKNQLEILSPEHCNSAVTTSCTKEGEICIYREEEFLKVLIHESFHIFGLDFSNLPTSKLNKSIKNIFPITSEMNLFEAYSETWSSLLNALLCSYSFMEKEDTIKDFLLYADICVQCEQIFSLFQCIKVLDFMGINYRNLYERDQISYHIRKYLYKEKTNVFSYYIIRSILMFNLYKFLHWCKKNNKDLYVFNKSMSTMYSFGDFIKCHYRKNVFLKKLEDLAKFKQTIEAKQVYPTNQFLVDTLRMSVCEMK